MKFTEGLEPWLQNGDRGISSNTMVEVFETMPRGTLAGRWANGDTHPRDPSDFQRCVLLLRAVPAYRFRLNELRGVSPVWNALVDNWNTLEAMLYREVPSGHGRAPDLYDEMKKLINENEVKAR